MKQAPLKIEITPRSLFLALSIVIGIYVFFKLSSIIVLVFLAIIFASALNPIVKSLQKRKVPRAVAILMVYSLVLSTIIFSFSVVIPPLVQETGTLITKLDLKIPNLPQNLDLSQLEATIRQYDQLINRVGSSIPTILGAIGTTFSVLIVTVTLLVMTYYLLAERDELHKYLVWIFGHNGAEHRAERFIDNLETQLGEWVRGQLILMFVIGFGTYLGLSLLGIPYALPLAILAGLLEVVPNIGPFASSIPAIAVALFLVSPYMAVVVIVFYYLIQQLENNVLVPKIMARSVNISPFVAIVVLLSGLQLGGILGTVLSIPTFLLFRTIVQEYYNGQNPLRQLDDKENQKPEAKKTVTKTS